MEEVSNGDSAEEVHRDIEIGIAVVGVEASAGDGVDAHESNRGKAAPPNGFNAPRKESGWLHLVHESSAAPTSPNDSTTAPRRTHAYKSSEERFMSN